MIKKQKIGNTAEYLVPHQSLCRKFIGSENAATAIEYALIAGGISVVIVASVGLIGGDLVRIFTSVASGF